MNQNRRSFIKNIAKGAALFTAPVLVGATTLPGTTLEILHLFGGHQDELSPEEQHTVDQLQNSASNGSINEDVISEELAQHPETRKQIILDAFVGLVIFPKGVLSKFFDENFASAALNTFLTIPLYLQFSDKETVELRSEEFSGAIKGVSMMNFILQGSEMIQVDVDRITKRLLTHKRQQGLLTYYADNAVPKKILNSMHVYVDSTNVQKQSVVVDENKIWITPHMFFLLLPVLSSGMPEETVSASIVSIVKKHIHSLDAEEKMTNIIQTQDIKKRHFEKVSKLSRDVQKYSLNLLQSEMRTLTVLFYITQLPFFGVGQAAAFKKKVSQISNIVYQLAISSGKPEHDANVLRKNILCLVTSYGPNRLALVSDIGPNTGALQKGGWDGLKVFVEEQLPLVVASGVSFYKNIERICSHVLSNTSLSSDDAEPIEKVLKDSLSFDQCFDSLSHFAHLNYSEAQDIAHHSANLGSDILHFSATALKDVGERLDDGGSKSLPIYVDASSNEAYRKHIIRNYRYISDDTLDLSYSELSSLFSSIPSILGQHRNKLPTNIHVHYMSDDGVQKIFIFSNLLHLSYLIQKHWDDGDNKFSQKIFESNEKHFINLIEDIKETHTHIDLLSFLEEHFSIEEDYSETMLFDLIYQDNILSPEISGVSDLSFSVQKEQSIQGSIVGNASLLALNVRFLYYGSQVYPDRVSPFVENFRSNVSALFSYYDTITVNKDTKALSFLLGSFSSLLDADTRNYYNVSLLVNNENGIKTNLGSVDTVESTNLWKKAEHAYESIADKLRDIIPGQVRLRDGFEHGFRGFVHAAEQYLGKNSREVIQMVLLLQSPFVLAVRRSAQRAITAMSDTLKSIDPSQDKSMVHATTEMMIGATTYGLSMFADNYIGLLVGVDLYKDLLGLDSVAAIGKVGKFSVYGGSQVISGNAPNPLLSLGEKRYAIYDTLSEEEKEKLTFNARTIQSNMSSSDLEAWQIFRETQQLQSSWAHGFDIVFDVFMLTLMNHGLVGKMFGSILLASRGDTFGNEMMATIFDSAATTVSSSLATILAPFKMLSDRRNK